jgi:hypothetical protein
MTAFWEIVLCSVNLMREAVYTSEMSDCFSETTWCYMPEGCHLHICCHDNLKSHKAIFN